MTTLITLVGLGVTARRIKIFAAPIAARLYPSYHAAMDTKTFRYLVLASLALLCACVLYAAAVLRPPRYEYHQRPGMIPSWDVFDNQTGQTEQH